jgi:7,8-dihydropterin-6-yl-methyl-4-(beta-D-ribofuranosyl)aminobenzene 5'-phosphate synthase
MECQRLGTNTGAINSTAPSKVMDEHVSSGGAIPDMWRKQQMAILAPIDKIEVQILVDNVTDNLSSAPAFVENEFAGIGRRRGAAWVLGGDCLCCAAHGLSCFLTLHRGEVRRTILFDAGPEDRVLEQNVSRLAVDLGRVEAMVVSHGHWDHAGAMLRALQLVRDRGGGGEIPCYMHPDMFRSRATKRPDGSFLPMQDVPSAAAIAGHSGRVVSTREPQSIAGGTAWLSGEIPRVSGFETGLPGQHRRTVDGSDWEPDELLMDERCLVTHVAGKGLVVFTACSHAGVVNVLRHARASFPGVPLHAVLGGLHLAGTNERIIPQTITALGELDVAVIAAGHCTGWRAMTALANAFGDQRLVPLAVGKRLLF